MKQNKLRSESVRFLEWCNTPVARISGEIGYRLRVSPQAPEYNTYIVIDTTGYSVLPKGKFLTTDELYEYWDENFNTETKSSEIEKYRKTVEALAEFRVDHQFYNSSAENAEIVLEVLIKNAIKRVSIFDTISNKSNDFFYALQGALIANKKVKICLNEELDKESFGYKKLLDLNTYYGKHLDVRLVSEEFKSSINSLPGIVTNFAIGDEKSYRIQNISNQNKAICNFNKLPIAIKYKKAFDTGFKKCKPFFIKL